VFARSSGILLHPTSLPGPYGIGDFGPAAYRFVDFLAEAGQRVWQVLPLGPTGYGDSPYQLFSAFAGNPLLISFDLLLRQDLLAPSDLAGLPRFSPDRVVFEEVMPARRAVLETAFRRFHLRAGAGERQRFAEFCAREREWLDDFALFIAAKHEFGGAPWTRWPAELRDRLPDALRGWGDRLASRVEAARFEQFLFFRQWDELKRYAHGRGVRILGDLPIYVAHDSADVWTHRELFCLDAEGQPERVAGVPPDYFSATGQLWGNPIYRWDVIAASAYRWWIDRMRATLNLFDFVRLDHFRGFEAHWEVSASEQTAVQGRWVKGPGAELFEALRRELGSLPIVAENLGVITPDVEELRARFGFPGMAVLQFAFGNDPQAPSFRPHNYPRNLVAYSGTHDNDTAIGWWSAADQGHSTRTPEDIAQERAFACGYLHTDGAEINWDFIRILMMSVADLVLFPLQDVLGLGSESRMNKPATPSGNWRWRYRPEMLNGGHAERLRKLARLYERA
jgi:4-alpha-glucanotransferase